MKRLQAFLLLGPFLVLLLAAGCSLPATLPAVEHSEQRPALIHEVQVLDGETLDVVIDGTCGEISLAVDESEEQVSLSALVTPIEPWCDGAEVLSGASAKLSEPLGTRNLVVTNPPGLFGQHVPCLYEPGDQWCRELAVTVGGETASFGIPDLAVRPVGMLADSDAGAMELSDGTILSLSTATPFDNPMVYEERMLEHPLREVWGSVAIHNIDRGLTKDQPIERTVSGFPTYLVTPAGAPHEPAQTFAIETGEWSVDVTFWSADEAKHQENVDEFLNDLRIRLRPGRLPEVDDSRQLVGGAIYILVDQDDSFGFSFSPVPVCDASLEDGCIRDVGFVGPGYHVVPRVAGLRELRTPSHQFVDELTELGTVDDLRIDVLDFGQVGELISCIGDPAFDEELLPVGQDRGVLHREVEIFTGIKSWRWRYRPGILTAYVGWPDAPSTVATYERSEDGSWRTSSVLACLS